jgi:RHS repeat-associated protein
MQENGTSYYYHNDHLGTPQKLTDPTGNTVWSATYTAFGEAEVAAASTIENNLRFPGQYYDEETNLHYNWNRYYSPETGRYTQVDPIGLKGGINLFGYAQNNPVTIIDPSGKSVLGHLYNAYQIGRWLWNANDLLKLNEPISRCRIKSEEARQKGNTDESIIYENGANDMQKIYLERLNELSLDTPNVIVKPNTILIPK